MVQFNLWMKWINSLAVSRFHFFVLFLLVFIHPQCRHHVCLLSAANLWWCYRFSKIFYLKKELGTTFKHKCTQSHEKQSYITNDRNQTRTGSGSFVISSLFPLFVWLVAFLFPPFLIQLYCKCFLLVFFFVIRNKWL